MKVSSAQIFNAAIQLMSGATVNSETSFKHFSNENIQKYIDIAQRTAALIPEVEDNMPNDDEIREAMYQILKDGDVGALLLSDSLMKRFGINRPASYVVTQRAVQLGMIKGTPISQNKTVYSLIK